MRYNQIKFMSFLKSSIGKKVIMSLTGLFLISFLVIHLIGNFQLLKLDDGYAFNSYAKFMTSNPIIKTISYLLYASILYHAILGLVLVFKNKSARKEKYAGGNKSSSPWTSRYMGILGTIMLVFIVIHMKDFWAEYKFDKDFEKTTYLTYVVDGNKSTVAMKSDDFIKSELQKDSMNINSGSFDGKAQETYKDLYVEVREAFHNPLYVVLYVLSMLAIMFHLWHGFKSACQSLGLNHPNINKIIEVKGKIISVVIPMAFAFIPLYIYFTQ